MSTSLAGKFDTIVAYMSQMKRYRKMAVHSRAPHCTFKQRCQQVSLHILINQFVLHLFHWNVCTTFSPVIFYIKAVKHRSQSGWLQIIPCWCAWNLQLEKWCEQRQISTDILLLQSCAKPSICNILVCGSNQPWVSTGLGGGLVSTVGPSITHISESNCLYDSNFQNHSCEN